MKNDIDDELTAAIAQAHPIITGEHERFVRAMQLVNNRHSKGALVELVNYLLMQIEQRDSNLEVVAELIEPVVTSGWPPHHEDIEELKLWWEDAET